MEALKNVHGEGTLIKLTEVIVETVVTFLKVVTP